MDQQELYQKSFGITYYELVKLASDFINFDCVGGCETTNNELVYYIKIDENRNNFNDKSEAIAFNKFLTNNFSEYNIDNESKPYNIILKERTLYFKTPLQALNGLLRAWKEWQIISRELKDDYFE